MKTIIQDSNYSIIFEGMTSISAIINSNIAGVNNRKIKKIYIDENKIKSKKSTINYLKANSLILNYDLLFVNTETIDALTNGNSHGGFIAECEERNYDFLPENVDLSEKGFYVFLDGIEDPYNFGYCLRSLYAAGVNGVILPMRNWMGTANIVSRSSAGASELLKIYISDFDKAIEIFKKHSYTIAAAGIRNSVSIYKTDVKKPILLIIGGEKRGISQSILQKADIILKIDYGRTDFRGSLSAASAASVMAFEIMRQNML